MKTERRRLMTFDERALESLNRSLRRAKYQALHAKRYDVRHRARGRAEGIRLAMYWIKQAERRAERSL